MKKPFLLFLVASSLSVAFGLRAQEVPELNLPWPRDFWSQGDNFARDRIYDAESGQKYLAKARAFYMKGFELIDKYHGENDSPNPYLRDPYKVYTEEQNLAFRSDFSWAYVYFDRAYRLFKEQTQWDAALKETAEYKDLLRKTMKALVMTSIYCRDLLRAEGHLSAYQTFFPEDESFFVEWKIRVLAMLVEQQARYDSRFTGEMSAAAYRAKYREFVRVRLEKEGDKIPVATRDYILDMITPELTYQPYDTSTLSTNFGR